MTLAQKIKANIDMGGINLILFKIEDKIFRKKNAKAYIYKILEAADESEYPKLLSCCYLQRMGRKLNLNNPVTYNEKIQWLKLYDNTPEKTRLADKYLVREWVKEKIGEAYLVPLLGVYESFDQINFDDLPNKFALKCNHGSGWNAIVTDKSKFDKVYWKSKFSEWLRTNYAFCMELEVQYKNISPKIVCEKLIEDNIVDYRVYCFGGKPEFIKVTQHNLSSPGGYDSGLFYPDWEKCEFDMVQGYGDLDIDKPEVLDELIRVASILSGNFRFVRVDFYIVKNKLYFSEMTFTPNSGYEQFKDEQTAVRFGRMINTDRED